MRKEFQDLFVISGIDENIWIFNGETTDAAEQSVRCSALFSATQADGISYLLNIQILDRCTVAKFY